MFYNILFGFIIPWLAVSPLLLKQPRVFIIMSPISAIISILINAVGFYFEFWHYKPIIPNFEALSSLPLDVGLYAVFGALMIYFFKKRPFKAHPIIIFLFFSAFTTIMEFIALKLGLVIYSNSWNIEWTFISYSVAYLFVITAWRIFQTRIDLFEESFHGKR